MSAQLGLFQVHLVLHLELHDEIFGATRGTKTSVPLREVIPNMTLNPNPEPETLNPNS